MTAVLNGIEGLGSDVRAVFRGVFRLLLGVLRWPFVALIRLVVAVRDFAVSSYQRTVGDERFFTGRAARALKGIGYALRRSPKSVPSVVRYYAGRSVARYGGLARYLLLLLMPLVAGVLLAGTLLYYHSLTPALEMRAGDAVLGYVEHEADYLTARAAAAQVLSMDEETAAAKLPDVTFTPALVKSNQFVGQRALTDTLLSLTDAPLVPACGVYVDGEYLCAVKTETDARSAFDTLLARLSAGADGVSSFVQDVEYRQGVYPASAVQSAQTLASMIGTGSPDEYVTTQTEQTVEETAADLGMTPEKLTALNPALAGEETVPAGTNLLVRRGAAMMAVKTVTAEVENAVKPYETVEIRSDALYIGTTRVVVDGETGYEQITNLVTYVDGERVASEEISRLTLKEPVAKTLQVGTRALDSSYVVATSYGGILLWPAVGCDRINSDYAYRWGKLHAAIDIGSTVGTSYGKTVVAAAKGVVVIAGVHSSYGYYVKIDHGSGMQTLYAHCMAGSLMVSVGQQVIAGQPIARVGATGYATGPHLHFEVIINGVRVDPKPYLGLK